jgi:putative transposase
VAELFDNKYRIPSRLKSWDYSMPGFYFITICTKDDKPFFGHIRDQQMHLSLLGQKANEEWKETFTIRKDMNLQPGEYIVMPNHFHAILFIGRNLFNTRQAIPASFEPQSKNLASVVRGFKSAVTMFARINNIPFDWQPRFHDHIIRSPEEYERIASYIINNPISWKKDKYFH